MCCLCSSQPRRLPIRFPRSAPKLRGKTGKGRKNPWDLKPAHKQTSHSVPTPCHVPVQSEDLPRDVSTDRLHIRGRPHHRYCLCRVLLLLDPAPPPVTSFTPHSTQLLQGATLCGSRSTAASQRLLIMWLLIVAYLTSKVLLLLAANQMRPNNDNTHHNSLLY